MVKRIIIFSPYINDRIKLEYEIIDYLKSKKSLIKDYKEIEIQKFSDIGECIRNENKIGTGGEILVIFDRRLYSKRENMLAGKDEKILFKSLKILLDLSKKVCDEEKIPYFMYEGEIEKDKKKNLQKKIINIEEKILSKNYSSSQ